MPLPSNQQVIDALYQSPHKPTMDGQHYKIKGAGFTLHFESDTLIKVDSNHEEKVWVYQGYTKESYPDIVNFMLTENNQLIKAISRK